MPEFKDIGKASKDLFKKPFNSGKLDIDIKTGVFSLSNSVTDKFTSKLERKDTDAFQGFVPGFTVPYKTILDGNSVKMEMSKSFPLDKNAVNVDYNTNYNIANGSTGHTIKMKYVGDCGLIAGTETCGNDPAKTSFHATYPFKACTFGVAGSITNPAALNYAITKDGISLETDLQKFALNIYNKVDNTTAIACQANWTAGSAGSSFGFAAKRRLTTGADVHIKTNMTGNVDVAHVSNISEGVKLTMSTNFNSQKFTESAPTFGMGLEFTL
jgi:hypothetical protein